MKTSPSAPRIRIAELEKRVRGLPSRQLLRFADWFDAYRTSLGLVPQGFVMDWEESPEQIEELKRRAAEAKAHPERLKPLTAGFFNRLRKELQAKRRQRANLLRRLERFEAAQRKSKKTRGNG